MNNPIMQMLQGMAQQAMGNGEQYAQQILQQNPQFAQKIQGQNVQQMAINMLKQQGIDPTMVTKMFSGR